MALIVQKYGGTSVATPKHIKRVARRIVKEKQANNRVIVVVSAIGKTTDDFIKMAHQISQHPPEREMDMLLSVGERISIALLAMAIHDLGEDAISFTGSQVGIITDNKHTEARILEVRANRLLQELNKGKIIIVAGFQGVSINKEITTLGRGGSDTTAIALAAALNADRCEIMKDVDGIFIAEPKLIPEAKLNREISYEEMIEMSDFGSGVLQKESIEIAKAHRIKIAVGSSRTGVIGTIVTDRSLDSTRISGIVGQNNIVLLSISNLSKLGLEKINSLLFQNRIKTYIYQYSHDQLYLAINDTHSDLLQNTLGVLKARNKKLDYSIDKKSGIVSIIGTGLDCDSNLMNTIFETLEHFGKDTKFWQVSPQRISWITPSIETENVIKDIYKKLRLKNM